MLASGQHPFFRSQTQTTAVSSSSVICQFELICLRTNMSVCEGCLHQRAGVLAARAGKSAKVRKPSIVIAAQYNNGPNSGYQPYTKPPRISTPSQPQPRFDTSSAAGAQFQAAHPLPSAAPVACVKVRLVGACRLSQQSSAATMDQNTFRCLGPGPTCHTRSITQCCRDSAVTVRAAVASPAQNHSIDIRDHAESILTCGLTRSCVSTGL